MHLNNSILFNKNELAFSSHPSNKVTVMLKERIEALHAYLFINKKCGSVFGSEQLLSSFLRTIWTRLLSFPDTIFFLSTVSKNSTRCPQEITLSEGK